MINVTITDSGDSGETLAKLEERVASLEQANSEMLQAFEMLLPRLMGEAPGKPGAAPEPCECGDPECPKQAYYEKYVRENAEPAEPAEPTGQYI